MLQSFHYSQYFVIRSRVVLLCIVKFLTIVHDGVKGFGSYMLLEKYGTKHFGTGISVYFHLGVGTTIVYLKHRHRHNAMFKFCKYRLALVFPHK